jgi:hypothetical protein
MKKFQFLLLDAGPIIKLFELGIWEVFIDRCDVTVSQTVADQAKWANQEAQDICIDLEPYEHQGLIKIIDIDTSLAKSFLDRFDRLLQAEVHPGERETLAFLCDSTEDWLLCSGDGAVFRVLGLLGKSQQGISLEEILQQIGLCKGNLGWEFSKKFREKYARMGQADSIQGRGVL